MRVVKISIKNILGIQDLQITPGDITVVSGRNAAGKTSVLEAIQSLFRGGHQATLLRRNELVGEVVLELDDGMRLEKRITTTRSTLTASHKAYGKLKAPSTWLKSAVDQLSVNPVAFLTATNRAELLLAAMPIEKDLRPLRDLLNTIGLAMPDAAVESSHALTAIAAVRDAIYTERTGVNRVAREAAASVKQLEGSLPDPEDGPTGDSITEQETMLARTRREMNDRLHACEQESTAALHAADTVLASHKAEAERDMAVAIAAAREEARLKTERSTARRGVLATEIREAADKEKANIRIAHEPDIAQQLADLSASREREKVQRQYENTRAIMSSHRTTAEEKGKLADELTAALMDLDGLKSRQLADLPIEGLEVRGRDIMLNDIPFGTLNHAEQVRLAVEVAKLRVGDIPLVCLDGLEALDTERFKLLTEALKAEEIQAIITTVSDDPELTIEQV